MEAGAFTHRAPVKGYRMCAGVCNGPVEGVAGRNREVVKERVKRCWGENLC